MGRGREKGAQVFLGKVFLHPRHGVRDQSSSQVIAKKGLHPYSCSLLSLCEADKKLAQAKDHGQSKYIVK